MSLKQDLANFKARNDYDFGLEILEKYLNNSPLLSLLRSGENNFTRRKLEDAIAQLEQSEPTTDNQATKGRYHGHPLIAQLDTKRKKIFLQTATMHGALEHVESNAKRFELAKGILENHQELQRLWGLHDYVLINGKLPEEKPAEAIIVKDFIREFENVRINRTKAKNKLSKATTDEQKNRAQLLFDKYEKRFLELDKIAAHGKIIV